MFAYCSGHYNWNQGKRNQGQGGLLWSKSLTYRFPYSFIHSYASLLNNKYLLRTVTYFFKIQGFENDNIVTCFKEFILIEKKIHE